MQSDTVEMLGLVAGFIGAFAFAPQAVKILRDRDASNVSALSYAMILTGALLWLAYGVFRAAPSIILWNLVAAGLAALVLLLKLRRRA
ncbi:SemiSWEET family sugar transporter [Terricaulis sp.]|uniref:SemiSWEET family sugar transporter n=1 Tax=Terricaulis sp. TaxID=2768686 RepID=UPI0037830CFF